MPGDKNKMVRPMFEAGRIKSLKDFVDITKKTPLATRIGKNGDRFNELLEHPEGFTIRDLNIMADYGGLTLTEMLGIIKRNYSFQAEQPKSRDKKYELVGVMHKAGYITSIEEIFNYIPRLVVAPDLGMKRQRLGRLIKKVETFELKELLSIGAFCNLSIDEVLELTITSYNNQKNKRAQS
jgi:hypothetical protein